jgi:hypothetical protein
MRAVNSHEAPRGDHASAVSAACALSSPGYLLQLVVDALHALAGRRLAWSVTRGGAVFGERQAAAYDQARFLAGEVVLPDYFGGCVHDASSIGSLSSR